MNSGKIGLIGALGGLSLALLKLIESQFFLNNMWSVNANTAYLTYFVYIFFGVVVSIYFTDRSVSNEKIKKNAFIMGLLAPSLLLAIASSPIGQDETNKSSLKGITNLTGLIVRSAHAEVVKCPSGTVRAPQGLCIKGQLITKNQVEPSFKEAFKRAIGRGKLVKKYTFIVGVTKDAKVAKKTANQLNKTILNDLLDGSITARVVKPEGHDVLYVAVGNFVSARRAVATQGKVNDVAINTLMGSRNLAAKTSAKLLLKGRLVEELALLRGATSRF